MSECTVARSRLHIVPRALAALAVLVAILASPAPARAADPPAGRPAVELKLPADIVYDHAVGADSAVAFRHSTHVDYENGRCTGCHPKLFRMLSPTHRTSHRDMNALGSCGACHDGKHAFDTRATESCASCHAGRKALAAAAASAAPAAGSAPAAFKGPAPIVYRQGEQSPGAVTFRHASHLGANVTCRTCHPKPFAMKSAGARPDGAMHDGAACGMCHDGKRSFATDDERGCPRCHVAGKGAR